MTTEKTVPATQTPMPEHPPRARKLELHKTTLLDLLDTELDGIRGGGPKSQTCSVRLRGCVLPG